MFISNRFLLVMIVGLLLNLFTFGQEDAQQIIKEVEARQNIKTSKIDMSMIIFRDMYNKDDYRVMRILAYGNEDEDSYMEFISPKTIKGLRILSKGNDQWIFFPSTGRVRKIASKSKGSSVKGVGGDFSYEDLGGGEWQDKYDFKIEKSDKKEWILEGEAKKEDSVYSRIVVTIDKSNYLAKKVDYYDKDGTFFKDLVLSHVKNIGGREMASRMTMTNHEKESMTVIVTNAAEYNITLDDKYFNSNRFYK